jgi:hypothetical protein
MTALTRLDRVTVGVALGLPCLTSLFLMFWAPGAITPTTYALTVTLVLATSAIIINTWRSAQGTGSMGQLLHETEVEPAVASTARARGTRWLRRYDHSAARALLALSLSVTLVMVWVWLR